MIIGIWGERLPVNPSILEHAMCIILKMSGGSKLSLFLILYLTLKIMMFLVYVHYFLLLDDFNLERGYWRLDIGARPAYVT